MKYSFTESSYDPSQWAAIGPMLVTNVLKLYSRQRTVLEVESYHGVRVQEWQPIMTTHINTPDRTLDVHHKVYLTFSI